MVVVVCVREKGNEAKTTEMQNMHGGRPLGGSNLHAGK